VILAFSLPKAYELKKPEIDDAVATGQARTKQLYDQHVAPHGACFNSVPSIYLMLTPLGAAPLQTSAEQRSVQLGFVVQLCIHCLRFFNMLTVKSCPPQWPRSRAHRLRHRRAAPARHPMPPAS